MLLRIMDEVPHISHHMIPFTKTVDPILDSQLSVANRPLTLANGIPLQGSRSIRLQHDGVEMFLLREIYYQVSEQGPVGGVLGHARVSTALVTQQKWQER